MNSKSTVTLKKLVMAALFAALACVATMSIKIPTPGTSGYIHPGDAIVILAGVVLGPAWGFLAGGIGSAMADLLGGYFVYVPITFVIKGLVSLCSALLYRKVGKNSKSRYTAVILGGVADIILVAGGYCLCEYFIYGSRCIRKRSGEPGPGNRWTDPFCCTLSDFDCNSGCKTDSTCEFISFVY